VEAAIERKPDTRRLGEQLIEEGLLNWQQLYCGLSILSGYEFKALDESDLDIEIARSLPRGLMESARVQPVRLDELGMLIATSEIPRESLLAELRRFTHHEPQVVLVTPDNLQRLRDCAEAPLRARAA
jgi:hypothetical protein